MEIEGKAKIQVNRQKIVSKKMPIFFNPIMAFNREISIVLLNSINKKNMQIGLPLAGSGVRGIRFLKELKKDNIKRIYFNDLKTSKSIKSNLALNNIKSKFSITNDDANIFLLNSKGFDYIDIDPFGTPNPYLDSSIKRIARKGILAITATDTSALCGTYPKACLRKYWAKPLRTEIMHEIGLRILIRKIQLIGAQYDKALNPIFSYSKDHYLRVFLQCEKGKEKVDAILKQHAVVKEAGPIWNGRLWDSNLVKKMIKNNPFESKELVKFLQIIKNEAKIKSLGFFHIPTLIKRHKLKKTPKQEIIINKIKKKGYKVSETHFMGNALRSDIPERELISMIKHL